MPHARGDSLLPRLFDSSIVHDGSVEAWRSEEAHRPLLTLLDQLRELSSDGNGRVGATGGAATWLDEWRPLSILQHGDLRPASVMVDTVKNATWLFDFQLTRAHDGLSLPLADTATLFGSLLIEHYPVPVTFSEVKEARRSQLQKMLQVSEQAAHTVKQLAMGVENLIDLMVASQSFDELKGCVANAPVEHRPTMPSTLL